MHDLDRNYTHASAHCLHRSRRAHARMRPCTRTNASPPAATYLLKAFQSQRRPAAALAVANAATCLAVRLSLARYGPTLGRLTPLPPHHHHPLLPLLCSRLGLLAQVTPPAYPSTHGPICCAACQACACNEGCRAPPELAMVSDKLAARLQAVLCVLPEESAMISQ